MEKVTLAAPPTITLDVYTEAPLDLRQRLRRQPSEQVASLLPGGVILEDSAEELTYRVALPGDWRVETHGEDICLTNDAGTTVRVVDGKLTLSIVK